MFSSSDCSSAISAMQLGRRTGAGLSVRTKATRVNKNLLLSAGIFVLFTSQLVSSAPSLKFFGPSHPPSTTTPAGGRETIFAAFLNHSKSMGHDGGSGGNKMTKNTNQFGITSTESQEYTRHLREVLKDDKAWDSSSSSSTTSTTNNGHARKNKTSRKYDPLFTLQFRGLADLLRQSSGCPDCVVELSVDCHCGSVYYSVPRAVCICGISHREERIVGGRLAEVNSYPWLAALEYRTKFYCGATLISNRYVLTAAHCVHGVPKDQITIVFGEHDRNVTHESPTHYRKIDTIIKHRSFNRANFYNDIAVLRMDKPIRFSRYISPACLPIDLEDEDFDGHRGTVAGWGRTQEKGKPSTILREVEVPIIANDECTSPEYSHYTSREITGNMMCAGYIEGKLDACQGDSGGPLNWERDDDTSKEGVKYVIGIVSWGQGCARPKYPGIYTRITKYLDWIRENTLDSCFCSNP